MLPLCLVSSITTASECGGHKGFAQGSVFCLARRTLYRCETLQTCNRTAGRQTAEMGCITVCSCCACQSVKRLSASAPRKASVSRDCCRSSSENVWLAAARAAALASGSASTAAAVVAAAAVAAAAAAAAACLPAALGHPALRGRRQAPAPCCAKWSGPQVRRAPAAAQCCLPAGGCAGRAPGCRRRRRPRRSRPARSRLLEVCTSVANVSAVGICHRPMHGVLDMRRACDRLFSTALQLMLGVCLHV